MRGKLSVHFWECCFFKYIRSFGIHLLYSCCFKLNMQNISVQERVYADIYINMRVCMCMEKSSQNLFSLVLQPSARFFITHDAPQW
jgi:hypothetical protein